MDYNRTLIQLKVQKCYKTKTKNRQFGNVCVEASLPNGIAPNNCPFQYSTKVVRANCYRIRVTNSIIMTTYLFVL
jgi:hypothetical protein